jgi:uncharacterized membrane protein
MPLFLGTTLTGALLAGLAIWRWDEPGAMAMLCVVGMFVVTMVFNVPLNNALAAAAPSSAEATSLWKRYLTDWTFWNHVRTVASTAASALFMVATAAR